MQSRSFPLLHVVRSLCWANETTSSCNTPLNSLHSVSPTLGDTISNGGQLHLTSYNQTFNCAEVDSRVARTWLEKTWPSDDTYSCVTLDADGRDVSPPNPPLDPPMSTPTKAAIGGGTVAGVLAGIYVWLIIRYKTKKRRANAARRSDDGGVGNEDVGGFELDDVAFQQTYSVVARRPEGVSDEPPRYVRIAKATEVPPVYGKSISSSSKSVLL